MAQLTYEQAKKLDDSDQRAIMISGKNPDGTDWDGILIDAEIGGADDAATETTLASISSRLAGAVLTVTGSANGVSTPIAGTDVSNASVLALQVYGTFNVALTFEGSNDNTNWTSVQMSSASNQGAAPVSQQPGSNQAIYTCPVLFRYFRVRVTSYSSGTVNLVLVGLNNQAVPATAGVTGSVNTKASNLNTTNPTFATVGTSSATAVPQNFSRKGLVLTNTSGNTIYLAFGAATAVVGSGIVLAPNAQFIMNEYTLNNSAINAIASGAGSNLAIQELS